MTGFASDQPLTLVGIDGSPEGAQALAWAANYATHVGGNLELLIAWNWPSSYGYPIAIADFDAEAIARTTIDKARTKVNFPADRLRVTVVGGVPAQELVEASARADLLVVGNRGHGGFTGLLLGSVGAHCVHHAHCPVVVVRPTDGR